MLLEAKRLGERGGRNQRLTGNAPLYPPRGQDLRAQLATGRRNSMVDQQNWHGASPGMQRCSQYSQFDVVCRYPAVDRPVADDLLQHRYKDASNKIALKNIEKGGMEGWQMSRVFTAAESAQNHCRIGNVELALNTMTAWIEDKTHARR